MQAALRVDDMQLATSWVLGPHHTWATLPGLTSQASLGLCALQI